MVTPDRTEPLRGVFARPSSLLAGTILVGAALAAYANSFGVPFLFDDIGSIVENPTIRQLWPPGPALSPPPDGGFTVSGRPVLNFSFAVNYAISGFAVWSYHALNLLIHVLAGLVLFGLVRRTLQRPVFTGRSMSDAFWLALVVATVWTLHPLQTESVTYIVQRAESLMGFFFLLTVYAFVRSVEAGAPHPRRWRAVSLGACLLGVGTKEVAALAPIVVLLYDRTFVGGSFRNAWRERRGFYLMLAATWVPLAWLLAGTGGNRGGTVGFDIGVSWVDHWTTQFEAVCRYLSLAVWPHPLVFEYGRIVPGGVMTTLSWGVPVFVLVVATLVSLRRWPVAGFLGAVFFGLLAPTSLVPGASQMIVEHRMYLPLAAVLALILGVASQRLSARTFVVMGLAVALAAGAATSRRNFSYRSAQALWEDTVAKRPANARAQNNLGLTYHNLGRTDDAIACYRESLRLDPTSAQAHYNLGLALMVAGRLAEAAGPFREAVRIIPYYFNAHLNLGIVLTRLGRPEEALAHFAEAIRFDPSPAAAHFHCGVALAGLGRWQDATERYAAALKLDPNHAEAHSNWGVALFQLKSVAAALEHFNEALRLIPDLPGAHLNLGLALASLGRMPEAVVHLERAAALQPDSFAAHTNLAMALAESPGRAADALGHYETALRIRPDDAQAHYNTGYALLTTGRWEEARMRFEQALKLQPGFTAAAEMLRQMKERQPGR